MAPIGRGESGNLSMAIIDGTPRFDLAGFMNVAFAATKVPVRLTAYPPAGVP